MKWLFSKCRRYEASLSLLAAGALDASERAALEAHLAGCPACQTKLVQLQCLARGLTEAGRRLPEIEAPISLRRRWMTEVRGAARAHHSIPLPLIPAWLSGRRLAWGSLAAIWLSVLLLRLSAPDAPKPGVVAITPISLRKVLLALEVQNGKSKLRADVGARLHEKQPRPEASPPRSQMRPVRPLDSEVA